MWLFKSAIRAPKRPFPNWLSDFKVKVFVHPLWQNQSTLYNASTFLNTFGCRLRTMKMDVSLFEHNKSLYVSSSLWITAKVGQTPHRATLDELHEHTMAMRVVVILLRALRLSKIGHQRGFDFMSLKMQRTEAHIWGFRMGRAWGFWHHIHPFNLISNNSTTALFIKCVRQMLWQPHLRERSSLWLQT